jgi:polygalacturonase
MAVGDVDGDGNLDAFVYSKPIGTPPGSVFIGWGNGTTKLYSQSSGTTAIKGLDNARAVTPMQLDGDGKLDLLVSFDANPPSLRYLGDGKGGFTPAP